MGSLKEFSFNVGGVKVVANDQTIAGVLLAHVLNAQGAIEFDHSKQEVSGLTPPALGEYWTGQGGVYFGLMRGDDGKTYHKIAALAKLKGKWGNYGTEIDSADSENDGHANTLAMSKAGCPLADEALALEVDGHKDFFLASKCELALCRINAREHFEKKAYWSSTQSSANTAWCQGFDDGYTDIYGKGSELCALAVRTIPQ